ncbi:PASTA domain-containing protein [Mycobacterium sp. WMMD1722]|uniref:PASTA domain-containing protein n=1 Tax=Mycobacterium sp. WMMD1722 TaxID=3404117 RepID=UPI003BF58C8A
MKSLVVATVLAPVAALTFGLPCATAQASWEMPELRGMTLAAAQAVYTKATDSSGPSPSVINYFNNSEVINFSNWIVCRQSPSAGTTITAKSKTAVGVNRPTLCSN